MKRARYQRCPLAEETTPKRVLLVDDEPRIVGSLQRLVAFWAKDRPLEIEIDTHVNGSDAFAAFLRTTPDLVVSDLHMPVMGGLELLHQVRDVSPDLPFILMSGHANKEEQAACAALGGHFEHKPMDARTFEVLLTRFLLPGVRPRAVIAVADDDPDNLDAVLQLLQDAFGDRVELIACRDGVSLVNACAIRPVVAVVTDRDMPKRDGLEAVIELRLRKMHVPAAIMTGHPDDESLRDAASLYGYAVFAKGPRFVDGIVPWLKAHVPTLA